MLKGYFENELAIFRFINPLSFNYNEVDSRKDLNLCINKARVLISVKGVVH